MAGKKPVKPMAGQTKQAILDPAIYGVQIKYYGVKGSPSMCPSCGKETIKGMVRLKNESFYCSLGCVSK
jgi:hypothetical protein